MQINLNHFFSLLPPVLRRRRLVQFILWLSPESKIQLVDFNGNARLYADISDRFPLTYFVTRSFDQEYLSIAAAFLKKGGHYFDVGANVGFCTFGLLPSLREAAVSYHLFEANQKSYDCLNRSAGLCPGIPIFLNHCAVTDHSGLSQLVHKEKHSSGSYLASQGNETVGNLCLDDYIRRHEIQRIEFMKLDIEGSEPAALRGAQKSLASGIVKAIYFEVSGETLSRYGENVPDYLREIRNLGFEIFFVKEIDFKNKKATVSLRKSFRINGDILYVSPVTDYPDHYDTDLLAIHRNSGLLTPA